VVAVCDDSLLGETLSEGDLQIHVSQSFYGGKGRELSEILTELEDSTIGNFIGNEIVSRLCEEGVLDESSVIEIAGIKHAQLVTV